MPMMSCAVQAAPREAPPAESSARLASPAESTDLIVVEPTSTLGEEGASCAIESPPPELLAAEGQLSAHDDPAPSPVVIATASPPLTEADGRQGKPVPRSSMGRKLQLATRQWRREENVRRQQTSGARNFETAETSETSASAPPSRNRTAAAPSSVRRGSVGRRTKVCCH